MPLRLISHAWKLCQADHSRMCYRPALTRTLLPPSQRRYSSVEADAAPTLKIKGGRPYNCRQDADRMSRAPDRPRHPQLRGRSGSGSTAIFSAGKLAHTPLLCCHLEGACPWPRPVLAQLCRRRTHPPKVDSPRPALSTLPMVSASRWLHTCSRHSTGPH